MSAKLKQDPTLPEGYKYGFKDRFWRNVNKNGPIPQHCAKLGPCWIWTAGKTKGGYGFITKGGVGSHNIHASRASWIIHFGMPPESMQVCHHCDNPPCVRPSHLFLGTALTNKRDSMKKNRLRVPFGESHPLSKLTATAVQAIRASSDMTQMELASEYGVTQSQISRIRNRKHWLSV